MFKSKNTKISLLTMFSLTGFICLLFPSSVLAVDPPKCYNWSGETSVTCDDSVDPNLKPGKCYVEIRGGPSGQLQGYNETSCDNPELRGTGKIEADCNEKVLTRGSCKIVDLLLTFINILSGLVGITAVIMLVVWGIQYTVSRDNPQMVASARLRILNTVLAVVFYLFIYAFLQWLVPGGIF